MVLPVSMLDFSVYKPPEEYKLNHDAGIVNAAKWSVSLAGQHNLLILRAAQRTPQRPALAQMRCIIMAAIIGLHSSQLGPRSGSCQLTQEMQPRKQRLAAAACCPTRCADPCCLLCRCMWRRTPSSRSVGAQQWANRLRLGQIQAPSSRLPRISGPSVPEALYIEHRTCLLAPRSSRWWRRVGSTGMARSCPQPSTPALPRSPSMT